MLSRKPTELKITKEDLIEYDDMIKSASATHQDGSKSQDKKSQRAGSSTPNLESSNSAAMLTREQRIGVAPPRR